MSENDDAGKSNIVYPLLFQNEELTKSRIREMAFMESKASPIVVRNMIAVRVFCALGVFSLILSALQPEKGSGITWISGFLMLSSALCFGIAAIYRFSKDFTK